MSKGGKFEISVGYPYPCWCDVMYAGEVVARVNHKELSDLRYAVEKAMQEARLKLGADKDEV